MNSDRAPQLKASVSGIICLLRDNTVQVTFSRKIPRSNLSKTRKSHYVLAIDHPNGDSPVATLGDALTFHSSLLFGHLRFIRLATKPAPKPLSIFTTVTFDAHELSIPSNAATPPKEAP